MNGELRALEFYETPLAFTRWLFQTTYIIGDCYEPCVGAGAILRAAEGTDLERKWITNDIDPRWTADTHFDATKFGLAPDSVDWVVTNPPFTGCEEILNLALQMSRVGVALYMRASFNEPLQTEPRRSLLRLCPPTGIKFLPRFAYQRSPTTGSWATDSLTACWMIWQHPPKRGKTPPQFIEYAPDSVFDDLKAETKAYRERMDALMGYTGSKKQRREQAKENGKWTPEKNLPLMQWL